jgi:hypothetical protein
LIIGVLGLLYGAQGVTQTAQTTMAQVWNVPQMKRGGFLPRLGRSVAGLVIIGGAFVVNAFVGTFIGGHGQALWLRIVLTAGLVALNVGLYYAAFWFLTPPVPDRRLLPGAIVGAVGFTALTTIGTGLIEHQLSHASATYGAFASVIALVTYLLLLAKITVYAAELNPVVTRHLWPRALPMAPPTEADEKVLSALAAEEQRWPEQKVKVSYQPDPVADGVPPGQTEPADREPQPAAREPEPAWAGAPRRNYGRAGGDGDGDRHGAGDDGGDDGGGDGDRDGRGYGGGGAYGGPRENKLPPRPPWPSTWPRPQVNEPRRAGN